MIPPHRNPRTPRIMVPLVYHPAYNITAFGLERLHPFDSRKSGRIPDALVARAARRRSAFPRPPPPGRYDFRKSPTGGYLPRLASPGALPGIREGPVVR